MRLKEIREEHELNQFEVADMLGVTRGSYSMWELERDTIPLKRLNLFCNIFHVSLDYTLGLTDNKCYKNSKLEIDPTKTCERLKDLRKKNHLTQEKLSIHLNITRSLISKYEHGTNFIITLILIEYSKYFNISCDYILGKIDKEINIQELVNN